jgi:hypothetical protein
MTRGNVPPEVPREGRFLVVSWPWSQFLVSVGGHRRTCANSAGRQ